MGYSTYYNGSFEVRPMLPYKVVNTLNEMVQLGAGRYDSEPGNLAEALGVEAPGAHCDWYIEQEHYSGDESLHYSTITPKDGWNYETEAWFDLVVAYIKRETPYEVTFSGEIDWDGDESDDNGTYTITSDGILSSDVAINVPSSELDELRAWKKRGEFVLAIIVAQLEAIDEGLQDNPMDARLRVVRDRYIELRDSLTPAV